MDHVAYLAYLARTVPPRALLRAGARRTFRRLRSSPNEAAPPSASELLRAFGCRSIDELAAALVLPAGLPALASPAAVAATARALGRERPDEVERASALADELVAGNVRLFHRTAPVPRRSHEVPLASSGWRAIDWERDPLGGARFDHGRVPLGTDPRRAWALGRLEDVVQLACAATLQAANDPRASSRGDAWADEAIDRGVDFAAAPRGIQWACPMEVALRGLNLALALRLLAGHRRLRARPRAALAWLGALVAHARFVARNLEDDGAVPNNHLVGDLVGRLAVPALWPPLAAFTGPPTAPAAALGRQLLAQTLRDGTSFEGSAAYHRLSVELFTMAGLLGAAAGRPPTRAELLRLSAMFRAAAALTDGRGLLPQLGDTDSQRALPFRPRGALDASHLPPIGAAWLGLDELAPPGPPPPELFWLLGAPGAERFASRRRAGPPPPRSALVDAGFFVLRSPRLTCAIAAGPNGTGGTGVHGHNDKLALEVCIDGALVLGDPGSLVYTADPALRNALRSTAAHSTVRVDRREQQDLPAGRLFALPEQAHACCLAFEHDRATDELRFVGEHRGYLRLRPGVRHRREVRLARGVDRLVVLDELTGASREPAGAVHELELLFQVPALAVSDPRECRPPRLDSPSTVEGDPAHDGRFFALALGPEAAPIARLVAGPCAGPPRRERAVHAPGYGERMGATRIVFERRGPLPWRFMSVLEPASAGVRREG